MIPCEVRLAHGVLTVALAEATDSQALVRHARLVAGESEFLQSGPGERRLTAELQRAFLDRLRHQRLGFMLKGQVGRRLVAVLTVVRPPHTRLYHRAELGLTVRASHWGQHIGRHMADVGIRLAQDLGVRKLNLSVRADNQRALRLYHSLGFEEEGRTARALRVGGLFFTEVNMGLCLDPPTLKNKACR